MPGDAAGERLWEALREQMEELLWEPMNERIARRAARLECFKLETLRSISAFSGSEFHEVVVVDGKQHEWHRSSGRSATEKS